MADEPLFFAAPLALADAHDLVDVLMRKVVLEHLADDAPWLPEDQLAGNGDSAMNAVPAAEAVRAIGERDDGRLQCAGEVVWGQLLPGVGERAEQGRVEEGALVVRGFGTDHVGSYIATAMVEP